MDRCARCSNPVDTDIDDEFYELLLCASCRKDEELAFFGDDPTEGITQPDARSVGA